ncbi:hypothetical protein LTR86_009812 [Recurvomyces mirabilis]|nr:hypothetical protein LTR86_009812 [Recurvomyces mirabilis]
MVDGAPLTGENEILEVAKGRFLAQGSDSWVDLLPRTDHIDFFRAFDFSTTSLGPKSSWSPALRLYVSMVLTDSRPGTIYWGPDRVSIYNEGFIQLISDKHPSMMGTTLKVALPEVWDDTYGLFEQAAATRKTIDVDNIALSVMRHGLSEECYFVGQFIPIAGDTGRIEGFYNTTFESTSSVLHERQRRVVEQIASIPIGPFDATSGHFIDALQRNPRDIPMAMLYSYDELESLGRDNLHLCGTIGIPVGHSCAPRQAHLRGTHIGIIPSLREALDTGAPVLITHDQTDPASSTDMFEGIEWAGDGRPSPKVLVVRLSSGKRRLGFYVQGINPRRPYDHGVEMVIVDHARQIEARWAASISNEEARQREETLERKLTDSESRLRHMAQSAPLGMCQISPEGVFEWGNDQFYDITGLPKNESAMSKFLAVLDEGDRERAFADFKKLSEGQPTLSSELRLMRRWSPPAEELHEGEDASDIAAWILTTSIAVYEDGKMKLLLGYVSDISRQKFAESVQARNAVAATQARRRQEEFIDTTSHEMRNPLSAITQLADGIARSLDESQNVPHHEINYKEIAQGNVSAAEVLLACAAHQKRVIDDVLILSRLESEMLSITPVVVQPKTIVENSVNMLNSEAVMNNITIGVRRDEIYDDLDVDYALCDTSRLTQILINLISNAIKFTAGREARTITVIYGAQLARPPQIRTKYGDLDWVPRRDAEEAQPLSPLTKDDDQVWYLYFAVEDSGPGLTPAEIQRLFKRFSQANSKTHISYGGSGLGLWISKELAEKQGGQMGVASRRNEGATFAFYIATKKAEPPDVDAGLSPMHLPHTAQTRREPRSCSPTDSQLHGEFTSNGHSQLHLAQTPALSESVQRDPQQTKQAPPQLGEYHILLVEDNLVNQKVLAKQLRKAGCIVHIANHGFEALEILQKTDCWSGGDDADTESPGFLHSEPVRSAPLLVDIILMDWEMPKMDGLTCTKRIRELEKDGRLTRRLPVVATTANVRQEQRDQALAAGMDSVMPKPFSVTELLVRISETL